MKTFTFMYCSRNDEYCGDAPRRLVTCIRSLQEHLQAEPKLAEACEILVIDWNSDHPLHLHEYWSEVPTTIPVRFCIVEPRVAAKASDAKVSEVHAYNVGAKVATGRMLLRLDQDTLVGRRFIQFLLDWEPKDEVWWCTRRESSPRHYLPMVLDPNAFMLKHGDSLPQWNHSTVHDGYGAVGVFGVPRSVWLEIRGYDETYQHFGYMEVEFVTRLRMLYKLPCHNLDQELSTPFYHIWHTIQTTRPMNAVPKRIQLVPNPATWGCTGETIRIIARTNAGFVTQETT